MRYLLVLACFILCGLLLGCDTPATPATPTPFATTTSAIYNPILNSPTTLLTLYPTSTPALYKPAINISRADYNAALAKWQAQHINEYEITSNELSLRSENDYPEIMQVRGDSITFFRNIRTDPTPFTTSRQYLESDNTIEGQFKRVADALDYSEQETAVGSQTVIEVQFDPTFGYPMFFQTDCQERSGEHNCPSDTYLRIRLSNFKILGRGTPLPTFTLDPMGPGVP